MKRGRTLKIVACLVALVIVSGLAGALMGRRLARVELERRDNPETWNETAMRTFERTVRPTPEQREKIQVCLDGAIEELKTIRSDTIARSTNVIWHLVAQVGEGTHAGAAPGLRTNETQAERPDFLGITPGGVAQEIVIGTCNRRPGSGVTRSETE